MNRHVTASCCALVFLLLSGCMGASKNPREGGLFSYNPKAYERRQQERRATIADLERSTAQEKTASGSLEDQRSGRQRAVGAQEKELATLNSGLASTSRKLDAARARDAAEQARINALRQKRDNLAGSMTALEHSDASLEAKRAERDALRRQLRQLEEEVDALSRL